MNRSHNPQKIANMNRRTRINILFLLHIVLLIQNMNTGVSGMITVAKLTPIISRIQCASRTLRPPSIVENTNSSNRTTFTNKTTDDDEDERFGNEYESRIIPPHCPNGYFCDFMEPRDNCDADVTSPCPDTESACFFSDLNREGAKECTAVCADEGLTKLEPTQLELTQLESTPCKFCQKGSFSIGDMGDGFISTDKEEIAAPCEFCASSSASTCSRVDRWDMTHLHRT